MTNNQKMTVYFLIHIVFLYLTYPSWINLFYVMPFITRNFILTRIGYIILTAIFALLNTIIIYKAVKKNDITKYNCTSVVLGDISGLCIVLSLFLVFKHIEGGLNIYPYHNGAFLPFLSGDLVGKTEDILLFISIMVIDCICYAIALKIHKKIKS